MTTFCEHLHHAWIAHNIIHHVILSAKERRPYIKIARESAVKHKDTVLAEINISNEFEKQKRNLDNDFNDIEDLIVTSYLKTKPSLPSTISIRETIRS